MDSTAHKGNLSENSEGGGGKMVPVISNLNLRRNQVRKREKISLNQPLTLKRRTLSVLYNDSVRTAQ